MDPTGSEITQLVARERAWLEAIASRDQAALDELLADGFSCITYLSSGPIGRARYLENAQRAFDLEGPPTFELLAASIHGDVAVVQGSVHQRGSVGGHQLPEVVLGTDIWIRERGRWRVLARHASLPAEPR